MLTGRNQSREDSLITRHIGGRQRGSNLQSTNMTITNKCVFNGKEYTMEFPNVTVEQFQASFTRWIGGEVIQSAFSYLDADQREFVMTGTPPHVWDEMFFPAETEN